VAKTLQVGKADADPLTKVTTLERQKEFCQCVVLQMVGWQQEREVSEEEHWSTAAEGKKERDTPSWGFLFRSFSLGAGLHT